MNTFFKLFLRVTMRNKMFSALNILGLAIGMAGFIVIMLWVTDELSYDLYNQKAARIYRIRNEITLNGQQFNVVVTPAPTAAALKNEFPEVESVARFRDYGGSIIRFGENSFREEKILYADSTLFDVFTLPFSSGDPKTALTAPRSIVLNQTMAAKYFGKEDPVGKMLTLDDLADYQITGVFKDIPCTSHFRPDFIASLSGRSESTEDVWVNNNFNTYVVLREHADAAAFEEKLSLLIDKYVSVQVEKYIGQSWEKIKQNGTNMNFRIQPLTDIHLYSNYTGELEANSDVQYVYIFSLVALFILVLACINFTNLSTAKASVRTKEVGLKKMYGDGKRNLAVQFVSESFIIVLLAVVIAVILVEFSLPYFNSLSGKMLSLSFLDPKTWIGLWVLILVTALLAGSYPALYLSSFKPIDAIRKEMFMGRKKSLFRNVLVTGQFVISLILMMSTLLLMKQMSFIQNKKLGFDRENIVVLNNVYLLGTGIEDFKSELLKNPSVESASVSGFLPIPSNRSDGVLFKDGIKTEELTIYQQWTVDCDYLQTLGMKIVEGRNFSTEFHTDTLAVLVNQTAVRFFGWDNPLGHKIGRPTSEEEVALYTVVGVVEDFNFESMHIPVAPLVFFNGESTGSITVRFKPNTGLTSAIGALESEWKQFAPHQPFEYEFFDDSLNRQYAAESRLGQILLIFTGLAFFVSALGLFGLALFTTEQRKKEIGIRKVNGSDITQIISLLSFDFTKLVLIAFVIATPVAWYVMHRWLENYAYKTTISWWIFVVTGIASYIITMITIGYQSYRAAVVNPVETLRSE
ncbi:MAG: ABC transporter permease [Bacteroidales bacterium]|nr:ABC transporter permease [Bacteroidales bacterium]